MRGDVHRKVILMGRLAVEPHPVVDGHVIPALLLQYEVGVNIAQLFRDAEGQMHVLTGAYRAEGLLEIGVEAIEQTRQKGSSFLKKSPGQRCHGVFVLWLELEDRRRAFPVGRILKSTANGSLFGGAGSTKC